jgi:hypothetical protein
MTRLDIVTKYNVNINILLCADNQLAPKSLWEISAPAFSATMTVGVVTTRSGYRQDVYGSMSNTNISTPAGANAVLTDFYWAGSVLALSIFNGSTTVAPNGWTAIGIDGVMYNRSSFTFSYNQPTARWLYTLSLATNPFGLVSGVTKTITLT